MLDAPIGSGADIFITIVIVIIATVSAVMAIDVYKTANKKPSEKK